MPPRAERDHLLSQLILTGIRVLVSIQITHLVERRHRAAVAASYDEGWRKCELEAADAAALEAEKVAAVGVVKLMFQRRQAEATAPLDDVMAERAGYVPDHTCCKTS